VTHHPLDSVRLCHCCGSTSLCRYNGAQIVDRQETLGEVRLFTCGQCRSTFATDFEARSDLPEAHVTDRREWGMYRAARVRGMQRQEVA